MLMRMNNGRGARAVRLGIAVVLMMMLLGGCRDARPQDEAAMRVALAVQTNAPVAAVNLTCADGDDAMTSVTCTHADGSTFRYETLYFDLYPADFGGRALPVRLRATVTVTHPDGSETTVGTVPLPEAAFGRAYAFRLTGGGAHPYRIDDP